MRVSIVWCTVQLTGRVTQGNHFEVELSNTCHLISDFLEHRNVPDDTLKRIAQHMKYASQKAPHIYSHINSVNLLPRILKKPLMNHLVNEQVCLPHHTCFFTEMVQA